MRVRRILAQRHFWKSVFLNYLYDARRYVRHSSTSEVPSNPKQLEARIAASSHVLEKGLSLKNPRLHFGKQNIDYLLSLLFEYDSRDYSNTSATVISAVAALHEYVAFHEKAGL